MAAEPVPAATPSALLFPSGAASTARSAGELTALALDTRGAQVPIVAWLGERGDLDPADAPALVAAAGRSGTALLPEHWRDLYTRPALRGHRLRYPDEPSASSQPAAGRDWSAAFGVTGIDASDTVLVVDALDPTAGLALRTEVESIAGGGLRLRHTLTNTGTAPFVVDGLEVTVPVPDSHSEVLDFTGRHERERSPQRHPIADGLWLREGRQGRTGLDTAMMLVTGPAGFGFAGPDVLAVHVAWSGNSVLRLERDGATGATLGGGELLQPGEVALGHGESYHTPWVHVVASAHGLDGVAAQFHGWLRSLAGHPPSAPVTLNVWEAVYFDHDLPHLMHLAQLAARVGVERWVLDDGWFLGRRDDTAGLGDWYVDTDVFPDGLGPLVHRVRELGMEFGLWFEPEMINPDSRLYREHPSWVLGTGGRVPVLKRNQLVLDLSQRAVRDYLFDRMHAVLGEYDVGFVKWDHNREILEAGSGPVAGAPVAHAHTLGFYRLLDDLRAAHPTVVWETCASGGGRIDLGVLERTQRVWTSDMTDALSRQLIQRWTGQLVPPEYLGAHISAPTSHQTGRHLSLDFRAATALFGSFGIEWDLATADDGELAAVAEWVARYKHFRPLVHSGRVVRLESADPAVLMHGVVAADGTQALLAHVQLDESIHNRGLRMRIPGLPRERRYRASWVGPVDRHKISVAAPVAVAGPADGAAVSAAVLATQGVWIPRRHPQTILLIHLLAVDEQR